MPIETYERSLARDADGGWSSLWVVEDTNLNNGQVRLIEAHLCGYRSEGPSTGYAPIPGTERNIDTNYRVVRWDGPNENVLLDSTTGAGGALPVPGGAKQSWTGLNQRIDNTRFQHSMW